MKVVTSAQMKAIDKRAIEEYGIPGLELMERAGQGILEHMEKELGDVSLHRVLVLCGKGNNGGDGFVLARKLVQKGASVKVLLLGTKGDVRGDAKTNLGRLERSGINVTQQLNEDWWKEAADALKWCTVKVDALLGTGARGPLDDDMRRAVDLMNGSKKTCVSVDVPTGVNSDTGSVEEVCVKANLTVTMAAVKRGLLLFPGKQYCGKIRVVDIGVPDKAYADEGIHMEAIDEGLAGKLLPQRSPTAHKGDCGRVLVIGGSVGMTGAIFLTCHSAMRAGAGLVFAGVPESLNDILEVKMTEPLTVPLPETKERTLSISSLEKILEILPGFDALALGPGLSRNEESAELARKLIGAATIPTVLDADGLNAFEGKGELLKKHGAPLSMTPHAGEMARLLGMQREDVERDRISIVETAARKFSSVTLLKGAPTLISTLSSAGGGKGQSEVPVRTYMNTTGSAALATAGSGDVLTGTILAFLGQGLSILDATLLGAYVHGLAGEIAGEEKGIWGVVASDVAESVPRAMRKIHSVQ
ncbi:MAG: NAD(P)H-hydrate dehydratase [Candidatus Eisenbacteria bacterium]|nr:NAD(P)H-hydrate dehydratase [Candidatus Eisenbacteria bacterium]